MVVEVSLEEVREFNGRMNAAHIEFQCLAVLIPVSSRGCLIPSRHNTPAYGSARWPQFITPVEVKQEKSFAGAGDGINVVSLSSSLAYQLSDVL